MTHSGLIPVAQKASNIMPWRGSMSLTFAKGHWPDHAVFVCVQQYPKAVTRSMGKRENLLANPATVGAHFHKTAKSLLALDIVGDVRDMRLMLGVDLVAD